MLTVIEINCSDELIRKQSVTFSSSISRIQARVNGGDENNQKTNAQVFNINGWKQKEAEDLPAPPKRGVAAIRM